MTMDKSFDAADAEARIAAEWEATNAFAAGANARRSETFTVMIPPPNVTGSLHIGHALNNTLQDILVRWHRMRGFDTLWQPGQDHAGIATQMVVERRMAERGEPNRREIGRDAFTAKIWDWKRESGDTIINQLKRLGASADWSRNAFTMSGAPGAPAGEEGNFHDAVIRVFVDLYNKGIIYRGKRLVNWDPHFETAISDLEVENREVPGHMWHFKYPLAGGATYDYVERDEDGRVTLRETRNYISIATTRPETMLGDGAVAVHPSDDRYAPIVGQMVEIPVGPKEHRRLIPIITDEYPDPDFGSGAVKITGAHDFNDYGVAMRNGIPLYALMDGKAQMRADGLSYADSAAIATRAARGEDVGDVTAVNLVPEDLRGLDRLEARKRVIAQVTAEGLAVTYLHKEIEPETGAEHLERRPVVEAKPIMQPFGDRSGVVIEPMLTDQWFVDTKRIVEPALEAVRSGRTEILPEQHKKVYFNWLENIEPWTISRQLWWGHQIPAWYCADCGAATVAKSAPAACPHCGSTNLTQDPDTLDTWFSSALWPFSTLGWPNENAEDYNYFYPTNTLVTGYDIIGFWVSRMIFSGLAYTGKAPFDTVLIHGIVRDSQGRKMSKSLGNGIDPLKVIDEYGADALRMMLMVGSTAGNDMRYSDEKVTASRNFANKLWNASRFVQMNLPEDFEPGMPAEELLDMSDKWVLSELARTAAEVTANLDKYELGLAAEKVENFIWDIYCDWYIEICKSRLNGEDAQQADTARKVLVWVLDKALKLLHPFMPFITEEIYQALPGSAETIMTQEWPDAGKMTAWPQECADFEVLMDYIKAVRTIRNDMNVHPAKKTSMTIETANPAAFQKGGAYLARFAFATDVALTEKYTGTTDGVVTVVTPAARGFIPMMELIDREKELKRLHKELEKAEKEANMFRNQLNNPKFVERAPEKLVNETRTKLAASEDKIANINQSIQALG